MHDPRCIHCGTWTVTAPVCYRCQETPHPPVQRLAVLPTALGAWEYMPTPDDPAPLLAAGWERCGPLLKYTHEERKP